MDYGKVRIGFAILGKEDHDVQYALGLVDRVTSGIQREGAEVIRFGRIVDSWDVGVEAAAFLKKSNIDLLLIFVATYAPDDIAVALALQFNCPIFFWSPPDPLDTPFPKVGSLVGCLQNAGTLVKLGKDVKILTDDVEDTRPYEFIHKWIKILSTVRMLRSLRVGLFESGCPGMLDTTFHELELRKQIGPEVVHISLSEFFSELKNVRDEETDEIIRAEDLMAKRSKEVPKDVVVEATKIYVAVKKIVDRYGVGAIAFRCWPEMKSQGVCSPCFALSKLSSEGIMASCEGDLTAAVSMQMLYHLTGYPAYLGDLLKIDKRENVGFFFHCGAVSKFLSEGNEPEFYGLHPDPDMCKPGLTVEFPLKPSRVTFARIGETESKYRVLITTGESVKTTLFVRGNTAKIKFDTPVEGIIRGLVSTGSEHHQIIGIGNLKETVTALSSYLGISVVEV